MFRPRRQPLVEVQDPHPLIQRKDKGKGKSKDADTKPRRTSQPAAVETEHDLLLKELAWHPGSFHPESPEDPWPYSFTDGDAVWVAFNREKWDHGVVLDATDRRIEDRLVTYYRVHLRGNTTAWFSPLSGKIKPDSHEIRALLREYGLIETSNSSATKEA
ncbi:hypothetical protein OE88DRAFT_602725 [Heliocybe sulcata]|uniref:Uncharacterized protein n=1 Tax=Heliocybe sulcata TaxID=5364 RepID=A0A5C3MSR9_9AGAM|nr:hypothetical protein OE88DRAFT_602725 [Heliocybe sulcata]